MSSNPILSNDQSTVFTDAEVLKSAMSVPPNQNQHQPQLMMQSRPVEEEVGMTECCVDNDRY